MISFEKLDHVESCPMICQIIHLQCLFVCLFFSFVASQDHNKPWIPKSYEISWLYTRVDTLHIDYGGALVEEIKVNM